MTANGPTGGLRGTKVLVLLPTRELAMQCVQMLQCLSKLTPITHALVRCLASGFLSHVQSGFGVLGMFSGSLFGREQKWAEVAELLLVFRLVQASASVRPVFARRCLEVAAREPDFGQKVCSHKSVLRRR